MTEEDKNSSPLDEGTEIIAHTAQTAYATTAAVAAGGTAAGMAAGTALAGPLGTVVGALVSNKTVLENTYFYFPVLFSLDVYYCKYDRNYF